MSSPALRTGAINDCGVALSASNSTRAVSVANLTAARTRSARFSTFSTRAAQAAQVIPVSQSSIGLSVVTRTPAVRNFGRAGPRYFSPILRCTTTEAPPQWDYAGTGTDGDVHGVGPVVRSSAQPLPRRERRVAVPAAAGPVEGTLFGVPEQLPDLCQWDRRMR